MSQTLTTAKEEITLIKDEQQAEIETTTATKRTRITRAGVIRIAEEYNFWHREARILLALYQHQVLNSAQIAAFCFTSTGFGSLGRLEEIPEGGYGQEYLRKLITRICRPLEQVGFISSTFGEDGTSGGKVWYIQPSGVTFLNIYFEELATQYEAKSEDKAHHFLENSLLFNRTAGGSNARLLRGKTYDSSKAKFKFTKKNHKGKVGNVTHNLRNNQFALELVETLIAGYAERNPNPTAIEIRVTWQSLQDAQYELESNNYVFPDSYVTVRIISKQTGQVLKRIDFLVEYDRATTHVATSKSNRFGKKGRDYAALWNYKENWAESWKTEAQHFPIILTVTEGDLDHAQALLEEIEWQLGRLGKDGKLNWLFTTTDLVEQAVKDFRTSPEENTERQLLAGVTDSIWYAAHNNTNWQKATGEGYKRFRLPYLKLPKE